MAVSKTMVWVGVILGSSIGGLVPELWGAGMLSYSSLVGSAVGALLGIWLVVWISGRL